VIVVGKSIGTGIILACALIHLLQPGAESLSSACVPAEYNTVYPAYAYLFAMIAALVMHFIDYLVFAVLKRHHESKSLIQATDNSAKEMVPVSNDGATGDKDIVPKKDEDDNCKSPAGLRHSHGVVQMELLHLAKMRRFAAYMLEFGVASHSVIIGITAGVTDGAFFQLSSDCIELSSVLRRNCSGFKIGRRE